MFNWVLNMPLHRGLVLKGDENKAMLKSMSMLNYRVIKSHNRNRQIFMSIGTMVWPYYFLGSSITLNENHTKKTSGTFREGSWGVKIWKSSSCAFLKA